MLLDIRHLAVRPTAIKQLAGRPIQAEAGNDTHRYQRADPPTGILYIPRQGLRRMQYSPIEWLLMAVVFGLSVAANLPADLPWFTPVLSVALQVILLVLLVFALIRYVALSIVITISMLLVGSGVTEPLAGQLQLEHWAILLIIGLMLLLSLGRHMLELGDKNTAYADSASQSVQLLFRAVEQGNLAWTYRLLAMGADINVRNKTGETPLMSAAAKGYADMVQVLIQNGANPRLENHQGESAMTIALLKGYTRIAQSLKIAEASHNGEPREEHK